MGISKRTIYRRNNLMDTGDIVFIRGKSIISKLVRYFDKGEFSHVAVAVSPTHIIEADWKTKSIIKPFEYEDFEVVRLNLNEQQKDQLIKDAIQLTGKWYDYTQILGYVLSKEDVLGSPKRLICSEIAYELLYGLGIDTGDRNISPNELYSFLTADTLTGVAQTI